ncbi:MAG: hypothetical protein IJD81_09645 [Oscillospiraceae bacterium]|nr:hypothetical protein [Oscillospiraceae bacterium]
MEYEAMELIEMMYSMIAEAKAMPLAAGRCIIERNDMLSMLEELRDSLPREMEEARRLWEAKEEFIASAKREAEQIRMEAEQKARQMVEEEEIVQLAKARADELIQNATAKQNELYKVVNQRIDQTVADSELALSKALDEVRNFRSQLSIVVATATPAPAPVQPAVKKSNLVPKNFEVLTEEDYIDDEEEE